MQRVFAEPLRAARAAPGPGTSRHPPTLGRRRCERRRPPRDDRPRAAVDRSKAIGQRGGRVKDRLRLGRQPARSRSRISRSGTGESAIVRDRVRDMANDRIVPVDPPRERTLGRQLLERAQAAKGTRHDAALVQVELGKPPERIAAQRESIAQRGTIDPGVAQPLDPGVGVRLGALGDLGRHEVVDRERALAAGSRDDDRGCAAHSCGRSPGGGASGPPEQLPPCGDHRVRRHLIEAVGHVAAAPFRRQANAIARAARQIDAHDAMRLDERSIAPRHRRSEDGQHRRAHGRGQMHRSGVAGQQQSRRATACRRGRRDRPPLADAATVTPCVRSRRLCFVDERAVVRRAGQHHRRAASRSPATQPPRRSAPAATV